MPEIYLRPEDVSEAVARTVLAFLNAATSAAEIADAVEFVGEPDVGLRVAEHILARRAELGSFTSLQQVDEVRQVGPERFTEIVAAIAGIPRGSPPEGDRTPAGTLARLEAELRALRAMVETLGGGGGSTTRVTLRPVRDRLFLGQPVTVVVTVTDARNNRPRVDAPIVLNTTWGRLSVADGYSVQQGSAVTARTGIDGTLRVTLTPPTSEDLWDVQQDALETMLQLLDPMAPTPNETASGLREMSRQYRWEANLHFRRAVDIYFRDFRHTLLDTVNFRDYMQAWAYFDATVIAFVGEGAWDGISTSVEATGALNLRFKDWLGPWLETYLVASREESTLPAELSRAKEPGSAAGPLMDRVQRRVRDYVENQRGLAGEYAGRRVAESSIRTFLQSETADLPVNTKVELFPALEVTSRAIATAGTTVVAAVGQARTDLRQELNTEIARVETERIGSLDQRVDGLQTQVAGKVDVQTFDTFRSGVDRQLDSKVDVRAFDTFRVDVDRRFEGKLNVADLDLAVTSGVERVLTDRLDPAIDARLDAALEPRLDNVLGDRLNRAIDTRLDQVLPDRVRPLVADKLDAAAFQSFRNEVNTSLQTKVDATTLNSRIGSLQNSVNLLNRRISDINR